MHSFCANTLNNNTIYLTLTPEVLATVYLNISISFKNSDKLHMYIVISSFVIINYEMIVNLIVWSFTLKLVLRACEYHLTWAWVPHIVREMSGNFRVSGEWSPCMRRAGVVAVSAVNVVVVSIACQFTLWVSVCLLVSLSDVIVAADN